MSKCTSCGKETTKLLCVECVKKAYDIICDTAPYPKCNNAEGCDTCEDRNE